MLEVRTLSFLMCNMCLLFWFLDALLHLLEMVPNIIIAGIPAVSRAVINQSEEVSVVVGVGVEQLHLI